MTTSVSEESRLEEMLETEEELIEIEEEDFLQPLTRRSSCRTKKAKKGNKKSTNYNTKIIDSAVRSSVRDQTDVKNNLSSPSTKRKRKLEEIESIEDSCSGGSVRNISETPGSEYEVGFEIQNVENTCTDVRDSKRKKGVTLSELTPVEKKQHLARKLKQLKILVKQIEVLNVDTEEESDIKVTEFTFENDDVSGHDSKEEHFDDIDEDIYDYNDDFENINLDKEELLQDVHDLLEKHKMSDEVNNDAESYSEENLDFTNDEDNGENEEENIPIVKNKLKDTSRVTKTPLLKINTPRGTLYHVNDGHYFVKSRLSAKKLYLKCYIKRCKVRAMYYDNECFVIHENQISEHCHQPSFDRQLIEDIRMAIFNRCETEDTPTRLIYNQEMNRFPEEKPIPAQLKFGTIIRSMQRRRQLVRGPQRNIIDTYVHDQLPNNIEFITDNDGDPSENFDITILNEDSANSFIIEELIYDDNSDYEVWAKKLVNRKGKCAVCFLEKCEFMCSPCEHTILCRKCKEDYAEGNCPVCNEEITKLNEMPPVMHFESVRGTLYHSNNGYYFVKTTERGSNLYLRCYIRKCNVRAVTNSNLTEPVFVRSIKRHNHEPDIRLELAKAVRASILNRCLTETTPLRDIYQEETDRFPEVTNVIPFKRMARNMQRYRTISRRSTA